MITFSEPTESNNTSLSFYQDNNYVEGELLVLLKQGVNADAFSRDFSNINLRPKELLIPEWNLWLMEYDVTRSQPVNALLSVMGSPEVKTIQFNHRVTERAAPNDTRFNEQWDMHNTGQNGGTVDADIDAPEAWDLATGGNTNLGDTVVVAVVDGGFDLAHQDLNFWKNWGDIPGNNIDDDGNGYIDDRNGWNAYNNNGTITSSQHGTHVSGTVGAVGNNSQGVAGVNWKVKVMPIQGSSGTESIVIKAYGYVLKQRKLYNQTNGTQGAFVVSTNASFGVDNGNPANYPLWCGMYDSLGWAGILNAGAGPNNNVNIDVVGDIPTACPSTWMISVTNTTNTDVKNSGAGWGPINMDLGAPGTNILSTNPSNAYGTSTGTSMATPHVAGAIGLMWAAASPYYVSFGRTDPDSMATLFKQYLLSTVDTLSSLNGLVLSKGRLNLFKAVQRVQIAGPGITHAPLPSLTENLNGPYTVNAVITPAGSNIDPSKTRLFWTRGTNFTDSVLMTNSGGNNWTANIPGNGSTANYRYYIKTADMLNRQSTAPGNAPIGYYSFTAAPDITRPVITHTAIPNTPKTQWPVILNSVVTDNLGLDSVWVRWYKNTPAGIKQFKLTNTSGNNFSAAFNSTQAEVNFNDVIFYRIYAQDRSNAHNRDSSALYSFTIINQANACIGSGTTAQGWPFYTHYEDSRTEMLYTAAEINGGGGAAGLITKLGFDVVVAESQVMNGFTIKMQHTTNSSISAFTETGWTTVYSGTYSVPGTGQQSITLQTPFAYNGTGNVLIQICFDNTDWTAFSSVRTTNAPGKIYHRHVDDANGCTLTGSNTSTDRPNICITVDMPTGTSNISSNVPERFELNQNYPNPFNPVTKINFAIPQQSLVSMKVFDITGREVAVLVNEIKNAGYYSVNFDGSVLASGIYFYRIQAGEFMETRRMVLVK
jgi:subtilisin family serine protease